MDVDPKLRFKNFDKAVFPIPKQKGCYRMGDSIHSFSFCLSEKPSFIKRFLMKHLLGFEWVDA